MRVVIVDDSAGWRDSLERQFCVLGHETWTADSVATASKILKTASASLIVSELRLGGADWRGILPSALELRPTPKVVILTSYGSVATAIRALRLGADMYLTKPMTAASVIRSLNVAIDRVAPVEHMSLDRAIWEFINCTVDSAGSIAEAARRLCVDRRSLRRMLAKYAPPEDQNRRTGTK